MSDTRRRRRDEPDDPDDLQSWESWPLWLLGASQGLNIFRWYAGDLLPASVADLLPWLVVLFGISAAFALDGAMIATVMGARKGRVGLWSWVAALAACLFSAAIAYEVHGGEKIGGGAPLHVAAPIVTLCYLLHLTQKRSENSLQPATEPVGGLSPKGLELSAARPSEVSIPEQASYPPPQKARVFGSSLTKPCRHCGEPVTFQQAGAHGRNVKKHGVCVLPVSVATQPKQATGISHTEEV